MVAYGKFIRPRAYVTAWRNCIIHRFYVVK